MTTRVQVVDNSSASTASLATTIAMPQGYGTLLALYATNGANATGVTGGGATWVDSGVGVGVTDSLGLWIGRVDGSPTTSVTVNFGGLQRVVTKVIEYSGRLYLDKKATASATSTTIATGSISPTYSGLVLALGVVFNAISAGPTGGFTDLTTVVSGTLSMGVGELWIVGPGSASTTWTCTSSGWDADIVALTVPGERGSRTQG